MQKAQEDIEGIFKSRDMVITVINLSSYLMVEQVKHTFNNEQHLMDMRMRGGTFVA